MTVVKQIDIQEAKYALARKDFFFYCNLTAPKFYKKSRQYLIDLCNSFQEFIESKDDDVLVINVGPRHGKSRTAGKFVEWIIGQDHSKKVMTGSYNETLSTTFSKSVRNAIQEIKADEKITTLCDVFPGTEIKRGDGAMNLWGLVDGYQNYLATSPGGTATGFGADIILIDDLIKNALEANNAFVLDGHWEWFVNTMLSRLETGGKIILIMTRWHSKDLAGRALDELPKLGYKVRHVNMKTLQDDGTMLCDEILTRDEYERKVRAMSPEIASANYQQEPIDLKGKLYSQLKEYEAADLPTFKRVASYTDTADEGKDYLASYIYGETLDNEAYILDVLYTKAPMEVTEGQLASKLHEHNVNIAHIESNNGGRGYARSVERILKDKYGSNKTKIAWFHQSKNKQARILSGATWVMDHVYFPKGWRNKWPELHEALNVYQREGKNSNDDAPDALTGIGEKMGQKIQVKTIKGGI